MSVTLITPSLPERGKMLGQALSDWANQTVALNEMRVGIDYQRQGPAVVRNSLANNLRTEWIAFGDDDDRFDPGHLATLLKNSEDADVVWTLCRIHGEDNWQIDHRCPPEFGQIPMTCLMRTEAFRYVGGFPLDALNEDEALFIRLADAGVRFRCVHSRTWVYQMHGDNRSRNQLPEGWEEKIRAKIEAGEEPTELTKRLLGDHRG